MKNRNIFTLFVCLSAILTGYAQSGRVGIAITEPRAGLDVQHNDGFIASGHYQFGNTDNVPQGIGTRLMWIPKKAAFRVGHATNNWWDLDNIGNFSIALGASKALGNYSAAIGEGNQAISSFSFAIGKNNNAFGIESVAIGSDNEASDWNSYAFGTNNISSAPRSIAIGDHASTTGGSSYAFGRDVEASGPASMAFGYKTFASGAYSTTMGTMVTTSTKKGAFIIGDASDVAAPTGVSADNKFTARFANGYLLYTSADHSSFVAVGTGGNAWVSSSDSTRKTNFVNADGELFLQKLREMRLGSWNYKKQDPSNMRHYGPMAQEFFAAYGKDKIGVIGNDTTLNGADVDGVAFIMLKALENRTAELTAENNLLKTELINTIDRLNRLEDKIDLTRRKRKTARREVISSNSDQNTENRSGFF